MKNILLVLLLQLACSTCMQAQDLKLLVMTKTNGFKHKSIPVAKQALQQMGDQNNWKIDFTEDSLKFKNYRKLKQYDAIVFLLTTGDILGEKEQNAFKKYIHKGGGFVSIHTGTDTEKEWPWYMQMIGAKFKSHPKQQQAKFIVTDSTHPSTKHLSKEWIHFDELYNYTDTLSSDIKVLLTVEESSYSGGTMGKQHPMAWCHFFEGGEIFQTSLGHTDESYKEEMFLQHIKGGIMWATIKRKKFC